MKYIVTTTINKPTTATLKFCEIAKKKDWVFVIVGDKKTPHDDYLGLVEKYKEKSDRWTDDEPFQRVVYLHPDEQQELYPKLSEVIGWNTIQRRNIGFVYAYKNNALVVASIDDDNIPFESWGDNLLVGQYSREIDCYLNNTYQAFDSLSVFKDHPDIKTLSHRGYPIEYLQKKNDITYIGKRKINRIHVQADFWQGDPDISAIDRLSQKPMVKFPDEPFPFTSNQITPFNSQNTFISRDALRFYCVLPFVGRYDDIWSSYILQMYYPGSIVFNKASVFQDRNPQDLIKNLENEIYGYRHTLEFLNELKENNVEDCLVLPEKTREFWKVYRETIDFNF